MTVAPVTRSEREATVAHAAAKGRSLWDDARRRLLRNRAAVASMALLAVFLVVAVLTMAFWPHGYEDQDRAMVASPPTLEHLHILGTDIQGRDVFARTMAGFLVSLAVGVVATTISLVIGLAWGATAGYVGGRTDQVMMRIVDVIYSLPYVFLVILLLAVTQEFTTGRAFLKLLILFAAIGGVEWLTMARIVRGQTLSLRRREFVEAAIAAGATSSQIIRRHIVPNVLGPVVVYMTLTIPVVILAESFLSFIGLGVQEPLTSLGSMIKIGAENIETMPWALLGPGVVMTLTLLCFNFIGDGLRDAIDPKDR
jgi:oligopeptide transport system permease protein